MCLQVVAETPGTVPLFIRPSMLRPITPVPARYRVKVSLVPRPSHRPQKPDGGKAIRLDHVNDVSAPSRQRGGGDPGRKNGFRAGVLRFGPGAVGTFFAS